MKRNEMRQELVSLAGGAHALAVQLLGNPDDAADAVQDSLATVLARPGRYQVHKGPLKPWFLRIVRNRCIDLLRQRRPTDDVLERLPDPGATPEQSLEQHQRDAALRTALRSLAQEHREIVMLRDFLDLSYAEIAAVLGLASGTVMSRLHRARQELKRRLDNDSRLEDDSV